MQRTVYTVQKATFCTEVYGLPVIRCTPDAVRTAIKIQSTFQRLRESCLCHVQCYNYGASLWTIVRDELLECRCDVGLSVRYFSLRSSKIDVSTFEDRCLLCLTFEDR